MSFQALSAFLFWTVFALIARKKMLDKCVVFRCNNRPNKEKGISLHPIPFGWTEDMEKRKRKKKWVDFVKILIKARSLGTHRTKNKICHFACINLAGLLLSEASQ